MNCDQAFDCLTDRHLRDSDELNRHLANCPRCRQMSETLEPAFGMFDSAVENLPLGTPILSQQDAERSTGPVLLSLESIRVAEAAAVELKTDAGRNTVMPRRMMRYAAAFLAGTAATMLVLAFQGERGDGQQQATAFQLTQCSMLFPNAGSQSKWTAQSAMLTCVACHSSASVSGDRPTTSGETDKAAMSSLRTCLACHVVDLDDALNAADQSHSETDSSAHASGLNGRTANILRCGWLAARG